MSDKNPADASPSLLSALQTAADLLFASADPGEEPGHYGRDCHDAFVRAKAAIAAHSEGPNRPLHRPDPAAIFGAAMSLYKLNAREDCDTSDVFQGHEVFMRACMNVATDFEAWACLHVDFDDLTDLWPYLLHDHFLDALEKVVGPMKGEAMRVLEHNFADPEVFAKIMDELLKMQTE